MSRTERLALALAAVRGILAGAVRAGLDWLLARYTH
jgi:hypothetical protein